MTPDGSGISVSYITKELAQYGDYTTVSDLLDLTAIDDVVLEITDRHGSNMGLTLDTVTRNEIQQGSQVIYAPKLGADGGQTAVLHRYDLTEGCKLTSELVAKAATQLKKMNAPTFEGKYVCILHPSVAFDLRQDPAWVAAHQYAAATELFSGEIGELHGVRFVETTEAKIFRGDDLAKNSRTLSVNGKVENAASVGFDGGTVAANALKGRYVLVGGKRCKVVGNTASQLTLDTAVTAADNDVIYPGEGGSQGCAVYGCLFLGKGAYGVVDLSEGTEVITSDGQNYFVRQSAPQDIAEYKPEEFTVNGRLDADRLQKEKKHLQDLLSGMYDPANGGRQVALKNDGAVSAGTACVDRVRKDYFMHYPMLQRIVRQELEKQEKIHRAMEQLDQIEREYSAS